jgi:hypothetical protein
VAGGRLVWVQALPACSDALLLPLVIFGGAYRYAVYAACGSYNMVDLLVCRILWLTDSYYYLRGRYQRDVSLHSVLDRAYDLPHGKGWWVAFSPGILVEWGGTDFALLPPTMVLASSAIT